MKTIKFFLPMLGLVCLILLLQNCRRERGCDGDDSVTEYELYAEDLITIPYKGFESLTFVRTTTGDTHTFVGDGWKQYWGLYDAGLDCPILERYEKRQLIFRSTTFPKPMAISIYVQNVTKSVFLEVGFQNQIFQEGIGRLRKPYDLDSVTILGSDYYGISYISDMDDFTPVTYNCYYNTENGIIRMLFENGETWNLLKP